MNEIIHFTKAPETQHFAEVKVSPTDNAYGVTWAEVVRNYLKGAYTSDETQAEVKAFGKTYKVLRRTDVTAFYDENGNTLFDVTNERLADEYEWLSKNLTGETEEIAAAVEENNKSFKVRAKEKLEDELKKVKDKSFAEQVIGHLLKRCAEDDGLAEDVCQKHKTWDKCFSFIYESARKTAKGNSCAVRDDIVYEWAEDYYHRDDKAEEEKKAKEKAEREKKQKEDQKKRIEGMKKRKTADNNKAASAPKASSKNENESKPTPVEKPKKNSKEMEGQMDLFSMMGL